MTVQEMYDIVPDKGGWRRLPSGVFVKLGYNVTLGNRVKLGNTPLAIQGTRHLATNGEPGKIQIGCKVYTFAAWKRHFKEIGKVQEYTPTQIKEYGKIIEFIIKNGRK